MKEIDSIFKELGFDSTQHFINSTTHPEVLKTTTIISAFFGILALYFESLFGILPVVGFAIVGLFFMELYTGLKASRKNKKEIKSKKFASGFIKLAVYFSFIGLANILQNNIPMKEVLGYKLDYYGFAHYVFLNFTILQYMLSNLENFVELGWNKHIPLIDKINDIINFKKVEDGNKR
jgi:Bacteriophage holin family